MQQFQRFKVAFFFIYKHIIQEYKKKLARNLMKQVIMLHVGQCGVQMANSCWQLFCHQHGISQSGHLAVSQQKGNHNTLFNQAASGKLTPRAVHVDLQPTVIDQIKTTPYRQLYNPSSMITGKEDTANNYIRGHYTLGKYISDQVEDRIRKQIQKTDYLQGIVITHSINGGTGSGLTSLLMERMSVNLPKKDKINLLVYPSQRMSDTVVQNYNAVLSLHSLLEHSSMSIPITNQRMYSIAQQQLDIEMPTFANINHLAAMTASNITAGSRFGGQNPWTIRDLLVNLVPYPRIHFVASSFNQFSAKSYASYEKHNVKDVTTQVFNFNNCCIDIGTYKPKFLSTFLMFRSQSPVMSEAVLEANLLKKSANIKFVDWIPTNIKLGAINHPFSVIKSNTYYQDLPLSCNMLSVNMRIDTIFSRVNHKFDVMYAKRAFVHWYVGQGLDEGFFMEAREDAAALEKDFEDGSDAFVEQSENQLGG